MIVDIVDLLMVFLHHLKRMYTMIQFFNVFFAPKGLFFSEYATRIG